MKNGYQDKLVCYSLLLQPLYTFLPTPDCVIILQWQKMKVKEEQHCKRELEEQAEVINF